jgi:catechol 2,3-dioxygenase-like lactoylglutathione lyase family enzyme
MSDVQPVLDQINLVVRDMDATLTFYRRLGLDIPDRAVWRTDSGAHHVTVTMPNGVDLEFAELIGAGYPGRRPPYDAFWGARYAIVADPDGNEVGLMSPTDPARRAASPAV